jgi:hypothetical protein
MKYYEILALILQIHVRQENYFMIQYNFKPFLSIN